MTYPVAISLNLSKEALKRLAHLPSISSEGFEEMLEMMQSRAEQFGTLELVRKAARELRHCPTEAEEVVQTVFPLMVRHLADGESSKDLVEAILARMSRATVGVPTLPAKSLALLRKRLSALVSSNQIALKAKALSLVNERISLLHKSKIVTDIRPVFQLGRKKSTSVEAGCIIHTLVLEYSENGEYAKRHIAVDSSDMQRLKESIDRAVAKERALSDLLAAAHLPKIAVS